MSGLDQKEVERTLKKKESDGSGVSDSLSDLLEHLSNEEMYMMLSEVSIREIRHLSVIKTMDDDLFNDFIEQYMVMKVSKNRKGRKELSEVAEAFSSVFDSEQTGITDRLKGLVQ